MCNYLSGLDVDELATEGAVGRVKGCGQALRADARGRHMFDEIFGLPVHALVIHASVVLLPLSALCVILLAVIPAWRSRYGIPVLALSTAAVLSVPVAQQSGKWLRDQLNYPPETFRHGILGDDVIWYALVFWILAALLIWLDRTRGTSGTVVLVVAILAGVAAVAMTVQVVRTGDAGARSVWESILPADSS
jgi:hypothetical protein